MAIELITPLPPGAQSFTKLAKQGAKLVVLRELKDGTDCAYPLGSPGLVTLQEVVEFQGKRQALFPWVPGVALREVLQALELVGQSVPVGFVARVLVDAARSLAGVQPPRAHGGLQDGSLQLGFDGVVSVLDFGAPRVTRFRAPGRVNFSADVFSLGGVLHAALTGFEGDYASRVGSLPAPSSSHPGVTPALDAVVLQALSAEPDSRQSGAGAFADALTAAVGDELFTPERVGDVVRTLFKERLRLLDELTAPDDEAVSLGDDSLERTQPRIAAPAKKELVPWASDPALPPVPDAPGADDGKTNPHAIPPLGVDADSRTQPRANLSPELQEALRDGGPVPAPEPSAPKRATGQRGAVAPRRSTGEHTVEPAPRMTGQRAALVPRRSTGEHVLASSSLGVEQPPNEAAPIDDAPSVPRMTGQRPALDGPVPASDGASPRKTGARRGTGQRDAVESPAAPRGTGQREAVSAAGATSPRASAPRGTGQRDALSLDGATVAPRGTGQRDALIADGEASPRASAPRGTGQRDALSLDGATAAPRGTGQRDALSLDGATAAPRGTGQRDALIADGETSPRASVPVGDADTNPRANPPVRGTGQRDALIADADTSPRASAPVRKPVAREDADGETNPRASAPVRATGQRDALGAITADSETNPRASAPRMTGQRAAIAPRRSTGETPIDDPAAHDATNPRASAPPIDDNEPTRQRALPTAATTDEEPDPTNPRAALPHRNTTTFERLQARGQERIETPPAGSPAVSDSLDEIREEPTAVRERPRAPDAEQTAQTAQSLKPTKASGGIGLSIMILVLLVVVVGIGIAVFKKVEQANAPEPLPMAAEPEPEVIIDAGVAPSETEDGGDSLEVLPVLAVPDASVEEEDDEGDAGEEAEEELDAGVVDAADASASAPVKKAAPKKKKRRHR